MRRALLLAVLLVPAGLAGCIGSDEAPAAEAADDGPGATGGVKDQAPANESAAGGANRTADGNGTTLGPLPDGSPVPMQANLTGCSEQGGVFPLPKSQAPVELPEGFSLVSMDPAGQTATVAVIGLSCSLNDEKPDTELHGLVMVQPPEELARESADFHAVMLGGFSSIQRQAQVYQAWGLEDMMPGNVTVEVLQETPVARGGHVLGSDGDFTAHMYTTVEGEPAPESAGAARAFGVADGDLTGAMDVTWTDSQGGYQTGEAALAFEGEAPIPQPSGAGVAFHFWGDSYDITMEYVDLPAQGGS